MNKKKNIAFFTITLSNGGAERVISNLLVNLSDERYEKNLILLDGDDITYPYKGNLINLKTFSKNTGVFKYLNFIFSYFKLLRVKKNNDFDVVISFLDLPNFLNIISKKNERVYVSVRTHISDSYKGMKRIIYGSIIKCFYNYSNKVIAVSNECNEDLKNEFNVKDEKLLTIQNFYDLEKIKILSEEEIDSNLENIFSKKVIINSGRLSSQKGQEFLIEAFSKLKNRSHYNLVILGEGQLRSHLEKLVKKLNIEDSVFLLGFQNNPFKYLNNSYLYVFPSFHEGFPNALAEAMACGLPVISNDCKSGPKELLDNGKYGILINDYLNKEKLSFYLQEAIEFLESPKNHKKYSMKSKERIKFFSKDKIIENWEIILK